MSLRSVVICCHCRLSQFMTESGSCRKCRKSLLTRCNPPDEEKDTEVVKAAVNSSQAREIDIISLEEAAQMCLILLRQTFQLSQREMAERVKTPRNQISKWETTKVHLTIPAIRRICKAFEIDVPVFISLTTEIQRYGNIPSRDV